MPEIRLKQLYQGGFVGSPIPPNETEPGCPDMENVRLIGNGKAFQEFPGFVRALQYELELVNEFSVTYPRAQEKRVFFFDAAVVFGMPGVGIAIVDYRNEPSRVLTLDYLQDADTTLIVDPDTGIAWDPSAKPILMLAPADDAGVVQGTPKLTMVSAHEYPSIIPFRNSVFIFDEKSNALKFTGKKLIEAGLRRPELAPIITCHSDIAFDSIDPGGTVYLENNADVTDVSLVQTIPRPRIAGQDGGLAVAVTHNRVTTTIGDPHKSDDGVLCYRNVGFTVTAGADRLQFVFMVEGQGAAISKSTFAIVLSPNTYNTGGSQFGVGAEETVIDVELQSGRWYLLDLPRPVTTALTGLSLGFKLLKAIPEDVVPSSGAAVNPINTLFFRFADINALTSRSGPFSGKLRAFMTYYNRGEQIESFPSSFSTEITLPDDGATVSVDITGFKGYWNATPGTYTDIPGSGNRVFDATDIPDGPVVDTIRIYLSKPEWGQDISGGSTWRLAGEVRDLAILAGVADAELSTPTEVIIGVSRP